MGGERTERSGEDWERQMYCKAALEKQQPQWMPAKEQKKVKLSSTPAKVFYSSFCLTGSRDGRKGEQRRRSGGYEKERLCSGGVRWK